MTPKPKRTKTKYCLENLKPFLETTGHSFDSVIDECLKLKDEVGYSTAPSRRTWNNAVSVTNGVTLTQITKIEKLVRLFFNRKNIECDESALSKCEVS